MQVSNLNANNFVNQLSHASGKDKIGWSNNDQGLTLTTGATLKQRILWKKPSPEDRRQIASSFLNTINLAVKNQQLGPNAKEINSNHFQKLFKKFSREGVSLNDAKRVLDNVRNGTSVTKYHPLKAAGQWLRNTFGFNTPGQLKDVNNFMKDQMRG